MSISDSIISLKLKQYSISLDTLKNSDKSYEFLFKNSTKIDMKSKPILEMFYKKIITETTMYQYVLNPEWGEASGNFRMKFIIVNYNNDYILVPFKVISMITNRYFSISMEPVSLNNDKQNIIDVLNVLKEFDIRYVVVIDNNCSDECYMNNYYNTLEEFNNIMDKSKYKSKRGVKKLSEYLTFHNDLYISNLPDKIKEVDEIWNGKKEIDKKVTLPVKTDVKLAELAYLYNDITLHTYCYNDIILGYDIVVTTCKDYASVLSAKTLTQLSTEELAEYMNEEDLDKVEYIKTRLGGYMQYMLNKDILKDKGYKALYYYGDVKSKSLQKFKEIYYKRIINYYKVDLDSYITEIGG